MADKYNRWVCQGVEFNIGDSVFVFFPEETDAPDGMGRDRQWYNSWVEGMDYAIGGTFEIADIREEGVEFVEYVDEQSLHPHGGYLYPLSSLVNLTKQATLTEV